jgi:hypothetical protein
MEITEQTLRQILKEEREEYQRSVGVIAEEFNSHVKLIAETLTEMQRQLGALRDLVARNTEDIEVMKMELSIIRNDLKEKVGRDEFGVLESRVANLERASRRR